MKSKNLLMQFLILFALLFATAGGYFLGRFFPGGGDTPLSAVPPLSKLNLPSQT
ncbi:MAG: hypothetical protein JNM46_10820, partial [Anaerolineales bacterium]|nr:hypothetical protein [Anaerolineales bacterium]